MRNTLVGPCALALALLAGAAPAAPAAGCPDNCITVPKYFGFCTSAAAADTTIPFDMYTPCHGVDRAGYDIPHGTLFSVSHSGFGGCSPTTTVEDDFTVLGPAAGTPVALTARLQVTVLAACILGPGYVAASLREGAAGGAGFEWDVMRFDGTPRDTSLAVPVAAVAGTPFRMRFAVQTRMGECSGTVAGVFSFSDLPAGSSVASCNGYRQQPVPVLPITWGRVKATYR